MTSTWEEIVVPLEQPVETIEIGEAQAAVRALALVTSIPEQIAPVIDPEPAEAIKPRPTRRQNYTGSSRTRSTDGVSQYLNRIGLYPLLTVAEERELAQTIEEGKEAQQTLDEWQMTYDQASREIQQQIDKAAEAKDRYIRSNLRLVVSVAKRYPLPPSMELLDLVQEGNLGLEHAVDKFDWRKGFKFSTYATFWIRQAIGRALDQKTSLVRLPGNKAASLRAALKEHGGNAELLDNENAERYILTTPTSLNARVGEEGEAELLDLLETPDPGPEEIVVGQTDTIDLEELLEILPDIDLYALEMRFNGVDGKKTSYRKIGEALGLTTEGARRRVKKAIAALQKEAHKSGLDKLYRQQG